MVQFQDEINKRDLLVAVGECIAAWTLVELHMGLAFADIIEADHTTAAAILDGIVSFEARKKAIASAMAWTLRESDLLPIGERLLARASKLSKKRNEVAHFALSVEPNGIDVKIIPYFSLGPRPDHPGLTKADVELRCGKFLELREAIQWFRLTLRTSKGLPSKSPQPEPDLIRAIRLQVAQNPIEPSDPLEPSEG